MVSPLVAIFRGQKERESTDANGSLKDGSVRKYDHKMKNTDVTDNFAPKNCKEKRSAICSEKYNPCVFLFYFAETLPLCNFPFKRTTSKTAKLFALFESPLLHR
jgi:hypothetical protein